jgi:hypothetical protein
MEKKCGRCKIIKPYDEFYVDRNRKDGRTFACIACCKERWKDYSEKIKAARAPKVLVEPTEKLCRRCDQTKPIAAFGKRQERANGKAVRSRCKECESILHREWRLSNPNSSRYRNLKSKYGISATDYMVILDSQDGVCAICRGDSNPSGHMLSVDHDHSTGMIRGLLCKKCNTGIGNLNDDPRLIARALEYLK